MLSEGEGFKGREKKEARRKRKKISQHGTQQSCRIDNFSLLSHASRCMAGPCLGIYGVGTDKKTEQNPLAWVTITSLNARHPDRPQRNSHSSASWQKAHLRAAQQSRE